MDSRGAQSDFSQQPCAKLRWRASENFHHPAVCVYTTMAGQRLVATPLILLAIAFEARILRLSHKIIYNGLHNVLYITRIIMYRLPSGL